MKDLRFHTSVVIRLALTLSAAAALLAGCGGGGTQPQVGAFANRAGRSWMAPQSSGGDLLYVSEYADSEVRVFSYPDHKRVGTITDVYYPEGECVDAAGDVFVANAASDYVSEFAHGGTTPIATYVDANHHPDTCSVDPTTGHLAVTEYGYDASVAEEVAIFSAPSTLPTEYIGELYLYTACAYDPAGNLFVDGYDEHRNFAMVELPKGGNTFENITLDKKIKVAGNVQWDGSYITVADAVKTTINRFTFKGTKGHVVGATTLNGLHHHLMLFGFQGGTVLVPHLKGAIASQGTVLFYNYPAGGDATYTMKRVDGPDDAVVSPYSTR